MKKASAILCCTVLAAFKAGIASAVPVTVKVTGHVTQWQDSTGLIAPYAQLSEPVTAVYTYDTVEPAAPFNNPGQYQPPASQASVLINVGPFAFQTGASSQINVTVASADVDKGQSLLTINAYNNPSLSNGVIVSLIQINFLDTTGQWPTSIDPPAVAPALTSFADSQITIEGPFNQNYFRIAVQVDSVALVPPALEISPPAGSFLPQQHFDAAVFLPNTGAAVATMQASVAGAPLALSYPGSCQLAPPNSAAKPALLCPGADAALASFQGVTQIDWLVTLTDGSSFTQPVLWNLVR